MELYKKTEGELLACFDKRFHISSVDEWADKNAGVI